MNAVEQTLVSFIEPALQHVNDHRLRQALLNALNNKETELETIEQVFVKIGSEHWTETTFKLIFNAWRETHFNLLAVYGLTCRVQRLCLATNDLDRQHLLLLASARNATTSYEALGLGFDGGTHNELYHRLAESFVSDDTWMLSVFSIPEARSFSKWVYRSMVVAPDLQTGLFTHLFSEIYSHAEHSVAITAFNHLIDTHFSFSPGEKEEATAYITSHTGSETELGHFKAVLDALEYYTEATNTAINYELAQETFETYLDKLAAVFVALEEKIM